MTSPYMPGVAAPRPRRARTSSPIRRAFLQSYSPQGLAPDTLASPGAFADSLHTLYGHPVQYVPLREDAPDSVLGETWRSDGIGFMSLRPSAIAQSLNTRDARASLGTPTWDEQEEPRWIVTHEYGHLDRGTPPRSPIARAYWSAAAREISGGIARGEHRGDQRLRDVEEAYAEAYANAFDFLQTTAGAPKNRASVEALRTALAQRDRDIPGTAGIVRRLLLHPLYGKHPRKLELELLFGPPAAPRDRTAVRAEYPVAPSPARQTDPIPLSPKPPRTAEESAAAAERIIRESNGKLTLQDALASPHLSDRAKAILRARLGRAR